jgi:hypothetical protein
MNRTSATLCAAALSAGALAASPSPAGAQDLDQLAPILKQLIAPQERLSESEIRERSLEAGVDRFLQSGRASPETAFESYRAYRNEQRRLEEVNRRRKQQRVNAAIDLFTGILKSR